MKHLKTFNENSNEELIDPVAIFYIDVFKAADFFEDISWKKSPFDVTISFTKSTGQVLNTYDIRIYKHGENEICFNGNVSVEQFTKFEEVMEFLNRGGKDLFYIEGWDVAQVKIWQKAIELKPELTFECPSEILKKLDKPSMGDIKNMGTFDI